MGEYAITNHINDVIKTLGLSSCVALTVYDPVKKVLGMAHVVLPDSPNEPLLNPYYYADKAVYMMVNKICREYGCAKDKLKICLYGGAKSIRKNDVFKIGQRNIERVKTALLHLGLNVHHFDIGGHLSRSIAADVATGTVKVAYQPLCL